jgi:Protein of unknown function (DUF3551)
MRQHWSAITRVAWIVPIAACAALSLTAQAGAQGTSPFCVVNSIGNLIGCYYVTIDYCQQMARGLGGACVLNPDASSRPTSSPSTSIADAASKWQEVGSNRRRMDQQKRQPLLDCLKVLGPSGLADCERLFGGR